MNKLLTSVGVFCLALVFGGYSVANEACLYSQANIDKNKYLSNKEFKSVKWDDKTNTAHIVTNEGEPLTVRNWACEHLSTEGELTLPAQPEGSNVAYVRARTLWLAKQILVPEDVEAVRKALEGEEFRKQLSNKEPLIIEGDHFTWLSLEVDVADSTIVVKLFGSLN